MLLPIASLGEVAPPAEAQASTTVLIGQTSNQSAVFNPMLPSLSYEPAPFDPDFWDPSILSASNWLDSIDVDFQGVSPQFDFYGVSPQVWDTTATVQAPYVPINRPVQQSAVSPVAVASTVSGQSGHSESAAEVCTAQDDHNSVPGEYYVDGDQARLPRTKRRRLSSKQTSRPNHYHSYQAYSLQAPLDSVLELKHRIAIPTTTYEDILKAWSSVCLTSLSPWSAFEASDAPPQLLFEHLLGLYFASFQTTLPMIHPVSFDANQTGWILILAMTAIGAQYLETDTTPVLAKSLHEFCKRCLFYQNEVDDWAPMEAVPLAQSRLLNLIGLTYCDDDRLHQAGLDMQHSLASSFRDVARRLPNETTFEQNGGSIDWVSWSRDETVRRVSYSMFLLDSMIAYHFQRRPTISLSDCTLRLPCHEKLWSATTSEDWKAVSKQHVSPSTIGQALQELYIEKRVPRDRGEFARIVLMHGLFHRSWEVSRYVSDPLSQWEPTATKQSSAEVLPTTPIWPPSIPTYNRWQNSVCDCLDVLHWQANATIGQATGLEHPTVAFLHLSRVVLLSPIDSIVRLAEAVASRSDMSGLSKDKEFIQRWAVQGQYKARLAAIHAGVVFWHIRRYSVDGFYEAPAVALATLMLWAFGTFSTKQTAATVLVSRPGSQDEGSDDAACSIILLDRPTDDELVQQFIRKGRTMRANISGVGDLYGVRGPERVLVEGAKLLGTLKCWGTSAVWLNLLQRLGRACKK